MNQVKLDHPLAPAEALDLTRTLPESIMETLSVVCNF